MQQNNSVTLFVTLSRRSLANLYKSENNHPYFVIKVTAATQTVGYTQKSNLIFLSHRFGEEKKLVTGCYSISTYK